MLCGRTANSVPQLVNKEGKNKSDSIVTIAKLRVGSLFLVSSLSWTKIDTRIRNQLFSVMGLTLRLKKSQRSYALQNPVVSACCTYCVVFCFCHWSKNSHLLAFLLSKKLQIYSLFMIQWFLLKNVSLTTSQSSGGGGGRTKLWLYILRIAVCFFAVKKQNPLFGYFFLNYASFLLTQSVMWKAKHWAHIFILFLPQTC